MTEKKIKKGIVLLVVLSIIFGLIIVYQRYSRQDTLTIGIFSGSTWDVPGTSYDGVFQEAIDKFHEKYPNIKITYEEGVPVDEYSDWLAQKILTGDTPDIFLVLPEDMSTLLKVDALENLNSNIISDKEFNKEDFYQSAYEYGSSNGIQYALPFECNPKLMFVNKTLLKKEGIKIPDENWKWDDFYEICKQVTKEHGGQNGGKQYGYYGYTWLDAVYSNRAVPFNSDGSNSNFTNNRVIEGVLFMKKMMETQENFTSKSDDFDLGNVAFRPLTFADYRTYMPYPWRIKKYMQFEWNCLPMPAGKNGDNISSMDTLMIGMSSNTVNKQIAWELMKLLTSDEEIQTKIFEELAGVSPMKKVTCSDRVKEILNADTPGDSKMDMSFLNEVMEKSYVTKRFIGYDTVYEYANGRILEYMNTDEELNLAMFELKKEIKKIMK